MHQLSEIPGTDSIKAASWYIPTEPIPLPGTIFRASRSVDSGSSDCFQTISVLEQELGLTVLLETRIAASSSFSLTDALALYHRLKGTGKTRLCFESLERSIRYLIECLGDDSLTSLKVSDAGRFRV